MAGFVVRLRHREHARFGERILPGGDMYEHSQAFLAWAASYDDGDVHIRSRRRHDQWLSTLPRPLICFEGEYSIKEHLAVLDKLCVLPCEEYSDLKKAVRDYESSGGRVKPASTSN